jgi:iron only hydrogenase large subunit-like protein
LRQRFAHSIRDKANEAKIASVSFVPCITQKYAEKPYKTDFALNVAELARMIKLAGIMIEALPEEEFDVLTPMQKNSAAVSSVKKETVHGYAQARKILEDIRSGECNSEQVQAQVQWIEIFSCPEGKGCSLSQDKK